MNQYQQIHYYQSYTFILMQFTLLSRTLSSVPKTFEVMPPVSLFLICSIKYGFICSVDLKTYKCYFISVSSVKLEQNYSNDCHDATRHIE